MRFQERKSFCRVFKGMYGAYGSRGKTMNWREEKKTKPRHTFWPLISRTLNFFLQLFMCNEINREKRERESFVQKCFPLFEASGKIFPLTPLRILCVFNTNVMRQRPNWKKCFLAPLICLTVQTKLHIERILQ